MEKEKEKFEKEREKFEQEMEREKEHLEQIMTAKDETITVLKEKFDLVESLKDFNQKPSTIQKWGSLLLFSVSRLTTTFNRHSDEV